MIVYDNMRLIDNNSFQTRMNFLQIVIVCVVCVAIISLASFIFSCCLRTIHRYPSEPCIEESSFGSEDPLIASADYNYGASAPPVVGVSDGRYRPTPFMQAEFVARSDAPPQYDDLFGSQASPYGQYP